MTVNKSYMTIKNGDDGTMNVSSTTTNSSQKIKKTCIPVVVLSLVGAVIFSVVIVGNNDEGGSIRLNVKHSTRRVLMSSSDIKPISYCNPTSITNKDGNTATAQDEEDMLLAKKDVGCISRKNKLVYVHIPKTGGSTVEQSNLCSDGNDLLKKGYRTKRVGGHHPIWEMMTPDAKERGISDYVTATTIRNPCERFVSAFRYVTKPKGLGNDYRQAMQTIGNRTLEEYVLYLENNQWQPKMMVHFLPQWLFVVNHDQTKIEVDTILCQEQWEEGIDRLMMQLEEKQNILEPGNHLDNSFLLEGLIGGRKVRKNVHESCADLSPDIRDAIERHYAMDYCLFQYNTFYTESNNNKRNTCVGTNHNKEGVTRLLQECQQKLMNLGYTMQ